MNDVFKDCQCLGIDGIRILYWIELKIRSLKLVMGAARLKYSWSYLKHLGVRRCYWCLKSPGTLFVSHHCPIAGPSKK
jgi:hypothetical protein